MISKKKQSRKQNRTLFLVVIFFILGLSVSFVFQKLNRKSGSESPLKNNALISMTSDKKSVNAGDEFTVTLTLDSKANEVAAADFVIRFDPEYLKVISVTSGNFFNNYPVNTSGNDYVRISGVATFDGDTLILPKGTASVGFIKFQSLGNKGQAVISFDKVKTIVATSGQDILDRNSINKLDVQVI